MKERPDPLTSYRPSPAEIAAMKEQIFLANVEAGKIRIGPNGQGRKVYRGRRGKQTKLRHRSRQGRTE